MRGHDQKVRIRSSAPPRIPRIKTGDSGTLISLFPEWAQALDPFQKPKVLYCLVLGPSGRVVSSRESHDHNISRSRAHCWLLSQIVAGFPRVFSPGAGNPGPGDREAGSFVPLPGPERFGLRDGSSEYGEVCAETPKKEKCAARVRAYLAGQVFKLWLEKDLPESRIGFLAVANRACSRSTSQGVVLLRSQLLWASGTLELRIHRLTYSNQSSFKCVSLKGVQLALQEVGVDPINICQES